MKKYFILGILLLATSLGFSQQSLSDGVVSGKVIDQSTTDPIEFATISVIKTADSSVVTGNVSEGNGNFIVDEVPDGSYYVVVSYIGYNEYSSESFDISSSDKTVNLGKIQLSSNSQNIDEVVVRERKDPIETRLDKRVFNASQDIASQSGTALEMMRNVPSIEVDAEGNISLRGKQNVRILIDGRPSSFTASDLLRQTPASRIEKIEIITNPGAKYDPEGTAGIINVVMKKNDDFGFNGNVNLGLTQATYPYGNGGVGLNMKNKSLNAYVNYSYSYRKRANYGNQDRFINNEESEVALISQDEEGYRTGGGHQVETGMDFYVNEWNTLYWSASYRTQDNPGEHQVDYYYYNDMDSLLSAERRSSTELDDDENYNFNVGWIKKFANPEHRLDVDVVYDAGNEIEYEEYFDRAYDNSGDLEPISYRERQDEDEFEAQLISRADYVYPFNENMTLEAGLRNDWRLENTDTRFYTFNQAEEYILDESRSNLFKYDEKTYAAYASWGHEIGSFGYKVGLRHETTFLTADLEKEEGNYDQQYARFYPSIHLTQKVGETNTFLLSYSRRIERPNSWQLNPFTDYNDPLNLRSGNPNLRPEDIHSIEAGYKKIWDPLTMNVTGYYRVITDQINRYVESSGQITRLTYQNFGTSEEIGSEMILSLRPMKWWNITTTLNAYRTTLSNYGALEVSNRSAFRFRGQLNSQMSLPNDYMVQVSGFYRAPFKSAQAEISAFRSLNLAFAKSFFDDRLNVSINARDIFNWMRFEADIQINDEIMEYTYHKWDSRRLGLSVTYNFGRMQDEKKGRREGNRDSGDDMESPGM